MVRLNPMRLQADLFHRFAGLSVELRQESAQRLEPLAAGRLTRRIADQQSKIRLQTAIDRVVKGQSQGCGRCGPPRDAALELALLGEYLGNGEKSPGAYTFVFSFFVPSEYFI